MAQKAPDTASTSGSARAAAGRDWSDLAPKFVAHEDTMSPERVADCWGRIYTAAGLVSPSEKTQAACRIAVYLYLFVNGASREGAYAGDCVMSDGHKFSASVIPHVVGKFAIRRFARGNAEESYEALKKSGAVAKNPRLVAAAADIGIGADEAFAMADWLDGCSMMTPSEINACARAKTYALSRSKRARGGHTLEEVEDKRVDEGLSAQGPADAGHVGLSAGW